LIALEDALNTLVTIDPRKAHVVSCAFSVGSTSRKPPSSSRFPRRPWCGIGSSRDPGCRPNSAAA